MNKITAFIALSSLFAVALFLSLTRVFAATEAGIIFQNEPNLMVSQVAEEVVTIQNSSGAPLDPGLLEIVLPAELRLQSATPPYDLYDNNKATWSIPSIPAASSYAVRFVVKPVAVAQGALTSVDYSVRSESLVKTQAATNIEPQVLGERTASSLPRTGVSWLYLVLIGVAVFGLGQLLQFASKKR